MQLEEFLSKLIVVARPARNFIQKYKGWILRFCIVFVTSLVLAIICELATYSYCVFGEGVRPPLEGIPFFRITVFFLSAAVQVIVFAIHRLLKWAIELFNKFGVTDYKINKEHGLVVTLISWAIVVVTFAGSPLLLAWVAAWLFSIDSRWPFYVASTISGFVVLICLSLLIHELKERYKRFTEIGSILGTVGAILGFFALVFYPPSFASFLTLLRFGGGIPISIEYEEAGGAERTSIVSGELIIRSTQFLIVKTFPYREAKEVNLDFVRSINYYDANNINDFPENVFSAITWNVESGGNSPNVIAQQLAGLNADIFALQEVAPKNANKYANALGKHFETVLGKSGNSDRLLLAFSKERFDLVLEHELDHLNDENHRSPLALTLYDKLLERRVVVVTVHQARGDSILRHKQSVGLCEWAKAQSLPILAIGDFDFEYDFETGMGNPAFEAFRASDTWYWPEPELINTNWADADKDGDDDFPDSMLDFCFVSNVPDSWVVQSSVIVRDGDFPDTDETSDHRPVQLTIHIRETTERSTASIEMP